MPTTRSSKKPPAVVEEESEDDNSSVQEESQLGSPYARNKAKRHRSNRKSLSTSSQKQLLLDIENNGGLLEFQVSQVTKGREEDPFFIAIYGPPNTTVKGKTKQSNQRAKVYAKLRQYRQIFHQNHEEYYDILRFHGIEPSYIELQQLQADGQQVGFVSPPVESPLLKPPAASRRNPITPPVKSPPLKPKSTKTVASRRDSISPTPKEYNVSPIKMARRAGSNNNTNIRSKLCYPIDLMRLQC
jgi:hypothetical protein